MSRTGANRKKILRSDYLAGSDYTKNQSAANPLIPVCAALYCVFVFRDMFVPDFYNDCLKYTFMTLIIISSALSGDFLLALAECAILPADYFLLFTEQYETGVLFFSAAMYIFILRHSSNTHQKVYPLLFLAISAANKTGVPSVYLIYACLFYYHVFILAVNKLYRLIPAFTVFALCDICVALNYISPDPTVRYLIWILYGMSQLLIVTCAPVTQLRCTPRRFPYLRTR